jgi:HEPN domain-containing protein
VHSLPYLLDLCEAQDPGVASLRERVEALAPYAVEIRYPGKAIEVSPKEAQEALATAESVWDFVMNFLPDESYPCSRK